MTERRSEVIIVGGGVTGTALLWVLSRFTNVNDILLIEKNSGVAQVNSHPLNNAQTSHDGGTETNYDLPHALEVKKAATILRNYIESRKKKGLFKKTHRMVLGVGRREVETLRKRYAEFKDAYPDLSLVGPKKLEALEPLVMKNRDPRQAVCALFSTEGYAIDYQKLSESFLEDALETRKEIKVLFDTAVRSIRRENGEYVLGATKGTFRAPVIVFAAGPYSLLFAQELGYGKEYAILPVAGSFFSGGELVRGKVYRVQIPGRPFAEIHADADVLNQKDTRFGPTTKPLPLMERHQYKSFFDFVKLPLISIRGLWALLKILSSNGLLSYVAKNACYDFLPFLGKLMFLREARVIIPSIKYRDLKRRKGAGGIRPQIVNLETGNLEMGDATIVGENCIFNTTPSPGASKAPANAKRDAMRVVGFLGKKYYFDQEAFELELEAPRTP